MSGEAPELMGPRHCTQGTGARREEDSGIGQERGFGVEFSFLLMVVPRFLLSRDLEKAA